MRLLPFTLVACIALILAGCASTPKEEIQSVEILEIKARYIPEEQFKRVSEYFTGADYSGKRIILRTDPEARDGFYFTLVLSQKVRLLPRGSVITGEFYTPVSKDVQIHEFPLPNKMPKTREVFIGLTGADWPEAEAVPGAWRFTIKDANGTPLADKKSYLWSI